MTNSSRVLVIDDEPGVRESLKFIMERDYSVFSAETMTEGISMFAEVHPDTVILDVRLPDMNGIKGLREIRKIDSEVSVIILTAYGNMSIAMEAFEFGANGFVTKPFDTHKMLGTIRENVNRSQNRRKNTLNENRLLEIREFLGHELANNDHLSSLGQSAAEYAHDLCGPLTAATGYLEILSKTVKNSKEKIGDTYLKLERTINAVDKNVNRCYELTKSWLSKTEAKKEVKELVSIPRLINEIVEVLFLNETVNAAQIKTFFDNDTENHCVLRGDPVQLYRAFNNIINNGVQALNQERGQLSVFVTKMGGTIQIRISDNGCGIRPENIHRIFEPYYSTKEKNDLAGFGLGLYIAKRIIQDHKGEIEVSSRVGVGTEFKISIPAINFPELNGA